MAVNLPKNLGMKLLSVWLILTGLLPFVKIDWAGMGVVLAVLAVAAGVLLWLGR